MTEEFWVLKRPVSLSCSTSNTEEFSYECNCNSLSLDHVCTYDSPEKADRFETKEEAMKEKRWIELGFAPAKYQMSLTECKQ